MTTASYATTKKCIKAPTTGTSCYACDAAATGATTHNGKTVYACKRHSDPTIKVTPCCIYCGDPVRAGSLAVDGDPAHHKCHEDATAC